MRKLSRVVVEGLLGRFDHVVDIDPEWEFVILHGPNGVGKTKLLEITDAALRGKGANLYRLPFDRAEFTFQDGHVLEVVRGDAEQLQLVTSESEEQLVAREAASERLRVQMRLYRDGRHMTSWNVGAIGEGAIQQRVIRHLQDVPSLQRVGPDEWIDVTAGEALTTEEATLRYWDYMPARMRELVGDSPAIANEFLQENDVFLVETQRLLQLRAIDTRQRNPQIAGRHPERAVITVEELAANLAQRIEFALAQNSRISQQYDKRFPIRLLSESPDLIIEDDDTIRDRFAAQTDLRSRLADIGVLDPSPQVPLPERELQEWERRVMSIYLADSATKLNTFEDLLRKVSFLREVVNSRFLYKSMKVDSDRGFYFETDRRVELSPSQLSSGEQHEVVLLYRLLFDVPVGAVVLLDEPEISLHIAWQQKVLDDLQAISEISNLQFLVATHSPSIVGRWSDRMVLLSGEINHV